MNQVATAQHLLPISVRFDLVNEDGAVLAPVAAEISLPVAVDVQSTRPTALADRPLPHGSAHGPALPLDVAWQPDIDRKQLSYRAQSLSLRRGTRSSAHMERGPHGDPSPLSFGIGLPAGHSRRL